MFLLVVDTCLDDTELEHLRDSLQQVGTMYEWGLGWVAWLTPCSR